MRLGNLRTDTRMFYKGEVYKVYTRIEDTVYLKNCTHNSRLSREVIGKPADTLVTEIGV